MVSPARLGLMEHLEAVSQQAWNFYFPPKSLSLSVGQNRIYTPYMTVCMVVFLPKILYIHRIYL